MIIKKPRDKSKINKGAKGSRKEKICYDELKNYPYRWKTIRHRFLSIDLFGMFDVVAANETEIRLIQVKSGYCSNEVREKIKAIKLPACCQKEIWCWFDNKGWKKEVIK